MIKKIIISLLFLSAPLIVQADTPWGVNMHLRERVAQARWDEVLDLAQDGRISWAREQFNWDVVEPTDDEYNFTQYDNIVSRYQSAGMNILGLITYSSAWASTNPGSDNYYYYPPEAEAWEDYVYNLALRYKDSINYWEIWNEPNLESFWLGTDEEYAEYLQMAADKIREANPEARIVLGGLSGVDTDFLEQIYNTISEDYFDVVAVHPYRVINGDFNYSPEYTTSGLNTLLTDLRNLNRFLRSADDADKPIWITEMGWTTYPEGINKKAQANLILRAGIQALTSDSVEKIFWYEFRNSADNDYLESNFGLVDYDLTAKKSFRANKFLNEHLRGNLSFQKLMTTTAATELDAFNDLGDWHFQDGQNSDGSLAVVEGRLKISYDFNKKDQNCYLPIANQRTLPSGTEALIFEARGDNSNNDFKFRITDSSGETFQYEVGKLAKEWQTFQIPLKYFTSSWNGNANGELDQPLKFDSFLIDDNPDGNKNSGTIYLDNLRTTTDGDTYFYKFKRGARTYYAFWRTSGWKEIRIKLGTAERIRVFSLGKSLYKNSLDGYFDLEASYTPKIIQVIR